MHAAARCLVGAFVIAASVTSVGPSDERRPRARDLGIEPGVFAPGPFNAITDGKGVRPPWLHHTQKYSTDSILARAFSCRVQSP